MVVLHLLVSSSLSLRPAAFFLNLARLVPPTRHLTDPFPFSSFSSSSSPSSLSSASLASFASSLSGLAPYFSISFFYSSPVPAFPDNRPLSAPHASPSPINHYIQPTIATHQPSTINLQLPSTINSHTLSLSLLPAAVLCSLPNRQEGNPTAVHQYTKPVSFSPVSGL